MKKLSLKEALGYVDYSERARSLPDARLLSAIAMMEADESSQGSEYLSQRHYDQLEAYYAEAAQRGLLDKEDDPEASPDIEDEPEAPPNRRQRSPSEGDIDYAYRKHYGY